MWMNYAKKCSPSPVTKPTSELSSSYQAEGELRPHKTEDHLHKPEYAIEILYTFAECFAKIDLIQHGCHHFNQPRL